MNKAQVLEQIIAVLNADLATLKTAVNVAHEAATDTENIAQNRYDTLAVEAAYLAHGQAKRAEDIEVALRNYTTIAPDTLSPQGQAVINSLIQLEDPQGDQRWLWLGNDAGGLTFYFAGEAMTVITPQAPLGAAMLGKEEGEVIELSINGTKTDYEIIQIR